MNFKKLAANFIIYIISIFIFTNSYAITTERDIQFFGNWKVSIFEDIGVSAVYIENLIDPNCLFRISLFKKGYPVFSLVSRTYSNEISSLQVPTEIKIGDKIYPIIILTNTQGGFYTGYLRNLPENIFDLMKSNRYLYININGSYFPIDLNGFKKAITHAYKLQKNLPV